MLTAFIPFGGGEQTRATVQQLRRSGLASEICLLSKDEAAAIEGCTTLKVDALTSCATLKLVAEHCRNPYALLSLEDASLDLSTFALQRLLTVAEESGAAFVYADYSTGPPATLKPLPLADWQPGSVRDDFDTGPVCLLDAMVLREAMVDVAEQGFQSAGFYALRLAVSRRGSMVHIPEFLYAVERGELKEPSPNQFAYVDPRNKEVQKEMEQAVTTHLKKIGAFLEPSFAEVDFGERPFAVEASIVIPVKNRVRTIDDAVASALSQQTKFPFNVLVVDNHSTDGTTGSLLAFAENDTRVVHIVPQRNDLGIGGCWNEALYHPLCGRFAAQLDSDDVYKDETTLQTIVDTFHRERCGMVVGSYVLTDFSLHEIPPGVITHSEWTAENGPNNALRVNGFGAPRAFFTPIARRVTFPNVSYGEDYAVALAISREYKVGRIFVPLYYCRRWEGNSDANLDVARLSAFNAYKDKIRTLEILARQRLNGRRT